MEKKIVSLNKELPQFFLEELEQRLETDPLSVGGLYDLDTADGGEYTCEVYFNCGDYMGCRNVVVCKPY
ncbi:hypothetical protein E5358_10935 [Palleniella muris]|uniref:Uncharacterized protein n=1 Tax=Palleniella muris TaxID=3038145 RepID=A0AC61QNN9_9BACT|nr:hypothetical protein [Palleniella muris]TGX81337.1 hypothetical protein E5358_10935 [Palleniella muris]